MSAAKKSLAAPDAGPAAIATAVVFYCFCSGAQQSHMRQGSIIVTMSWRHANGNDQLRSKHPSVSHTPSLAAIYASEQLSVPRNSFACLNLASFISEMGPRTMLLADKRDIQLKEQRAPMALAVKLLQSPVST
eukprot:6198898-Pleurochrysis_carterae.AAC.1